MQTEQKDLLSTQLNADSDQSYQKNGEKNPPLQAVKKLFNTPFSILRRENKYSLVMGNYMIIEDLDSEEQVVEALEAQKWQIMVTAIFIVVDRYRKGELNDVLNIE